MKRTCKDCKQTKPIEEFATYKRDGKELPRTRCRECFLARERERQNKHIAENREAYNARARDTKRERYQRDPEFREKLKAKSREFYHEKKRKDAFHPVLKPAEPTFQEEFDMLFDEVRGRR